MTHLHVSHFALLGYWIYGIQCYFSFNSLDNKAIKEKENKFKTSLTEVKSKKRGNSSN